MADNDIERNDRELSKKIEKVIAGGDIARSREQQGEADRLIRQQKDYRKRHGLDRRH